VLVFVVVAVLAPVVSPHDPLESNARNRLQPPSLAHPFGTDSLGRDVFARVVYGAQLSLLSMLGIVAISSILGIMIGFVAATFGGFVDQLLMRVADIALALPQLLVGVLIAVMLGPSLRNAILAVALVRWPDYTRLTRALVVGEREKLYVEAARSIGASSLRINTHILFNIAPILTVKLTYDAGAAILLQAGLSFLGLGAQPPTPEWGSMIAQERSFMLGYPWTTLFPGVAVFLSALGFSFLGDVLRDLLDPRARA